MTRSKTLSFAGTLYDSEGALKRAMTHEFITASGLNTVESAKEEIEHDLDGCAEELYEDYDGKEYLESVNEARDLLRDWEDLAEDALTEDDPADYMIMHL